MALIKTTPFGSEKVIEERISNADLRAYLVGFDLNDEGAMEYRWKSFTNILLNVLQEFAFAFHEGEVTDNTKTLTKIVEAARAIYKIEAFQKVKEICEAGGCIDDKIEDKYLRRGEFGELILHLLLRDFHETIPLISKIYFKDAYGATVHGFDAVHISPETKTLWLGESKLYLDPKIGLKALIEDIKQHIKRDYLNDEFTLISKKLIHFDNIPEKDYWLGLLSNETKLSNQIASINIPLLCTYTCDLFSKYEDENLAEFREEFNKEISDLKKYFDNNNNHPLKGQLNIILLLFPVKCKKELVKRLHSKISLLQEVGR